MKRLVISLILFLSFLSFNAVGQLRQSIEKHGIYKFEQNYYFSLRSNGWGLGYRSGKFITGYKKRVWDFNLAFTKDLKEKRTQPIDINSNGKAYVYGVINKYYVARVLRGTQKVISSKPYWGGVEIRTYFLYGVNTGFSKPVYHHIITPVDKAPHLERYDPDIHDYYDIYGRGPFKKGISETKLHPGLSLKAGLDFEFGTLSENMRAIEIGCLIDGFAIPYTSLAAKDPSYYMFSIYLSFHTGSRINK